MLLFSLRRQVYRTLNKPASFRNPGCDSADPVNVCFSSCQKARCLARRGRCKIPESLLEGEFPKGENGDDGEAQVRASLLRDWGDVSETSFNRSPVALKCRHCDLRACACRVRRIWRVPRRAAAEFEVVANRPLPEPVWVCSATATFMLSNLPVPFCGI